MIKVYYFCNLTVFASSKFKSNLIVSVHFIATPAQGAVDDQASLSRHSKRLQDELRKSSPDEEVIKELMNAEFSAPRSFITKIDVHTRVRDTLAKYRIFSNGNEVLTVIVMHRNGCYNLRLLQTVNESYICTRPCDFNDLVEKDYTYLAFNSHMHETLGLRMVQLDSHRG